MSLFPMTPEEQKAADITLIRKVLVNERTMREKVFRHNERQRLLKVNEIDQALKALERLEGAK